MVANMTAREKRLRAALKCSMLALDTWLHIYASDQCDPKRVAEAQQRIRENGGLLAYIADVQQQNREAMK